jgi:hypothetical protein
VTSTSRAGTRSTTHYPKVGFPPATWRFPQRRGSSGIGSPTRWGPMYSDGNISRAAGLSREKIFRSWPLASVRNEAYLYSTEKVQRSSRRVLRCCYECLGPGRSITTKTPMNSQDRICNGTFGDWEWVRTFEAGWTTGRRSADVEGSRCRKMGIRLQADERVGHSFPLHGKQLVR